MGFLVFVMAIIPNISDRSMHLLKAEVPGPVVGKIVPRIKDTSKLFERFGYSLNKDEEDYDMSIEL